MNSRSLRTRLRNRWVNLGAFTRRQQQSSRVALQLFGAICRQRLCPSQRHLRTSGLTQIISSRMPCPRNSRGLQREFFAVVAIEEMRCPSKTPRGNTCSRSVQRAEPKASAMEARNTRIGGRSPAGNQAACADGGAASGCTAKRKPIALRMADRLLSAGLPLGDSVR